MRGVMFESGAETKRKSNCIPGLLYFGTSTVSRCTGKIMLYYLLMTWKTLPERFQMPVTQHLLCLLVTAPFISTAIYYKYSTDEIDYFSADLSLEVICRN